MSQSSIDCWVCGAPADRWKLPESHLCGSCMGGGFDSLRVAGFDVTVTGEGAKAKVTLATPPRATPTIQVAFGPEGIAQLFRKLVKKELQVGRKEIDDMVYFEYADPGYLPLLNGYEVGELLVEIASAASVVINNDKTTVAMHSATADVGRTALIVGSLLHALRIRQDEILASQDDDE